MRPCKLGARALACGAGGLAICLLAGFRVGRAAEIKLVTREVSLGKGLPGAIPESLAVSPDSRAIAYVAGRGGKRFVVVDGVQGKEYDWIGAGSLVCSTDSKRLTYVARRGGKPLVVVDGVEGKEYDGFLSGSSLVFDNQSQFHTLAGRGDEFLRVEVEIVTPAAEASVPK